MYKTLENVLTALKQKKFILFLIEYISNIYIYHKDSFIFRVVKFLTTTVIFKRLDKKK